MKKRFLITISMIMIGAALMFSPINMDTVHADSASVAMSGKNTVAAGEKFVITVKYTGSQLGSVTAYIDYNTDVLTYVSGGSSSGNGGIIKLNKDSSGGAITFKLNFKGAAKGSDTLKLNTAEMYDLDGNLLNTPYANYKVTVTDKSSSGGDEDTPGDGGTDASDDADSDSDEAKPDDQASSDDQTTDDADLIDTENEDSELDKDRDVLFWAVAGTILLLIIILAVIYFKKYKGKH